MIGISHKSRLARAHAIAANADAIAVLLTRLSALESILENEICTIHRVVIFARADICRTNLIDARRRRNALVCAISALVHVDTCARSVELHADRTTTNALILVIQRTLATNAHETRSAAVSAALAHTAWSQNVATTACTRACTAR